MGKYGFRRLVLKAGSRVKIPRTANVAISPNVLFIWIPKTAGTSVFNLLQNMGMGKYKSLDRARHIFPGRGMATFVHQSIPSLMEAGAITQKYVEDSFKFSFLRNPYDRAVSLYYYFHRFQRMSKGMSFVNFLEILEQEWEVNRTLKVPVEEELPDRVCYRGEWVAPTDHTLYPVGPYNVFGWSQCRPQSDWLQGVEGEIHLGRMENIDEDCKVVLDKIFEMGAEELDKSLELCTRPVPKANTTPHGDYREHYRDPALKRIVERVYQTDFENFSY